MASIAREPHLMTDRHDSGSCGRTVVFSTPRLGDGVQDIAEVYAAVTDRW